MDLSEVLGAADKPRAKRGRVKAPAEIPSPESEHLTDLGNARRLVRLHGADLRYCHPWHRWLPWDGARWRPDETGTVLLLARDVIADMLHEAAEVDSEERKPLVGWATKSERRQSLEAMVALAQSEPRIPVLPGALDADPWLLNCRNGTLDLRSGKLRPFAREDMLTKLAPVEYEEGARSELWERVLSEMTGGDRDLEAFIQRAIGYSLTGDTGEEVLFFVHGPGAAGKSTFLEAVKHALGDYALTADFETFLKRKHVGGPRNDVAQLAGSRFVVSIEVEQGKTLAVGLVKMLTGGDSVRARFLHKEHFEFKPQFKLWLSANHAPAIDHDDSAIWRRILRIPFVCVVPPEKRDKKLKKKLMSSDVARAILAWAVAGCRAWNKEGLQVPQVVQAATEDLREDMDTLRDFFEECCFFDPSVSVLAGALRDAHVKWSKGRGEHPIANQDWGAALKSRGATQGNEATGERRRIWRGVGLRRGAHETDETEGDGRCR